MKWPLAFITKEQLEEHVRNTIFQYDEKRKGLHNLNSFNNNIIDPIKFLFDRIVYQKDWPEVINNEIIRQIDKSNNNAIGYFHQYLFSYIKHCRAIPKTGMEQNHPDKGWDVVYENPDGIKIYDDRTVHKVFAEIKNKHNTMNSGSAETVFKKMKAKISNDDDCACYLVQILLKPKTNG